MIGMEQATEAAIKAKDEVDLVTGRPCSQLDCWLRPSVKAAEWLCRQRQECLIGNDEAKGMGSMLEVDWTGVKSPAESGNSLYTSVIRTLSI